MSETTEQLIERLVGGPAQTGSMVPVGRDLAIGGAFDGASQVDRALAMWAPPLQSADAEMLGEKDMLDARVRDMRRNDGYVQTGQALHRDHIVGAIYMLNATPDIIVLGLDEKWAEDFQQETEAKFMLDAESDNNWFDASRTNTLTGMIRLAVGVIATGGEYLATAEWIKAREDSRRPFKTTVQAIDSDRLSTPYNLQGTNSRIRNGVQLDRRNAPIGYHIRKGHQSDFDHYDDMMTWDYVPIRTPWGRQQVLHIKEQMRIDQTRGYSDMVAGLKETFIAKKFRDVTLQQAVLSASFAASIESDLPSAEVFSQMGAGGADFDPGGAAVAYAAQYLDGIARFSDGAKNMAMNGLKIPHFFPGTKLQLKQIGAPAGMGMEFEQSILRYLSAILGVSYEELSHDYSKTNYSSAKAGQATTYRFMQSRKKAGADKVANFVYLLWLEEMIDAGQLECMKSSRVPNFYEPRMKEAYGKAEWIGAARGQIDELKETQAATLRIKFGLSTREDELARLGKDWRKVFAQLEREQKVAKDRNLVFVEDNSMNAASGTPRENKQDGTDGG